MSLGFYRHEDSTASRCLGLLARHGPRLMREGGGCLTQEKNPKSGSRVTPDEVATFKRLLWEGHKIPQIAAATGRSITAVTVAVRVPGERRSRRVLTSKKDAALKLLLVENNCAEIARRTGTTRGYVAQLRREMEGRAA